MADRLAGLFDTLKGTYAGLFTTDISTSGVDPTFGFTTNQTKTGEVRYSIEIVTLTLGAGTSYNSLKAAGGTVGFTAIVHAEVGGKTPIEVPTSGSFTLSPFPDTDNPTTGTLSGLTTLGSDYTNTVNAGGLAWTPTGLTGVNLSAHSPEFSFNGVSTPATLVKGGTPPAPSVPVDYNQQVIDAVTGTYKGTYTTSVTFNSPFSVSNKSVTVTVDVTTVTANEPTTNPQSGGRQFRLTGTFRVQVSGKADQFVSFTGLFLPDAFTGSAPITGRLSFTSSGGTVFGGTSAPDLAWTPTGVTGTNFSTLGGDYNLAAASTPFTWTKQ